jgi:hypothetical protein
MEALTNAMSILDENKECLTSEAYKGIAENIAAAFNNMEKTIARPSQTVTDTITAVPYSYSTSIAVLIDENDRAIRITDRVTTTVKTVAQQKPDLDHNLYHIFSRFLLPIVMAAHPELNYHTAFAYICKAWSGMTPNLKASLEAERSRIRWNYLLSH